MKYIKNFKIALVDNDYVVRAKVDYVQNEDNDTFREFLNQVKEELIPGQTAHLEIQGFEMEPLNFEISRFE